MGAVTTAAMVTAAAVAVATVVVDVGSASASSWVVSGSGINECMHGSQ